MSGAFLRDADLREAQLIETNLSGADLRGAIDLRDADLRGANLSYARDISGEQLEKQAKTLEGATMPNEQKYEDWLKDRERDKE